MSEPGDVTSFDELVSSLSLVSRWKAHVIATRCSLRAMLRFFDELEGDTDRLATFLLGTFRCSAISYAFHFLERPNVSRAATLASDFLIEKISFPNGINSVTASVFCAEAVDEAKSTFLSLESASDCFDGLAIEEPFWRSVSLDLRRMGTLEDTDILTAPLWPKSDDADWDPVLRRFLLQLKSLPPQWNLLEDWFLDVQKGSNSILDRAKRADFYRVLVSSDREFWERDPHQVIREIGGRWHSSADEVSEQALAPPRANSTATTADFFISYSASDEAEAREIAGFLEEAGYSTIVQSKDFPVGSNLVIEMQEALERGARAIALLSPDYVASDYCRAEWAAIYAMDPIGKKRKLVSFLLKPTELNRLARQIVYKSLFGLRVDERRQAVLEAIRHQPESAAPGEIAQRLAETASPDVISTPDEKLDAVPNATFDRAVYDVDLPDLPTALRSTVSALLTALPANAPPVLGAVLEEYRAHLDERGTKPIVGLLVDYAETAQLEFNSTDFELWGAGLSHLFKRYFSYHAKFLGHYPLSQERERTFAEAEVDEDLASGRDFVGPVTQVADAIDRLAEIGGVTPGYERVVKAQARMAVDIDGLPPNAGENAGKGNDVTPKRRFVLMQIGFWERSLAALAGIATLAATPQGRAAVVTLQRAIEAFLKFVV